MDAHDPDVCIDEKLWEINNHTCYENKPDFTAPGAMVGGNQEFSFSISSFFGENSKSC